MVKLIQNIPSANDGEQHTDDNNNIAKYLGSNKDRILALTEKNYENLVEVFTNNVINTAAASSSSNSSLSPTFNFVTWNQSDVYRIEESESFPENKGDIAD